MDSLSATVNLLILASREDEATDLVESLRNGGLAVRGFFTSEPERLQELAEANPFELILCCEYDPAIDLDACMSHYEELDVDVPMVIVADKATKSAVLIDALRAGARDSTTHGDAERLQLVVARELSDLRHRRAENRLREQLEECAQRSRGLVDTSGKAVAFVQEGIHPQAIESHALSPEADTVYGDPVHGVSAPAPDPSPPAPPETARGSHGGDALEKERIFSAHIGHSLEVDRFQLVYQPIVSLSGDSQECYSVLLRRRQEDGTLQDAADLLATAARSGQMLAIDRGVIRNAIAEIAAQHSTRHKVNFFVDLSEEALQEEKLLIWICDGLRALQVRGNWLTLQVLEEHACRHTNVFNKLSEGLRKVGCRIALARFGEGSNPDVLLQNLRPSYVKLPPTLGQSLADDKFKQRRLLQLTKLCREADVKSVVTGVEDARSLTLLWSAGIDYVQGDFLQRPTATIGNPG